VEKVRKRVNVMFVSNNLSTLDGAAYYTPKHLTLKFTIKFTIQTYINNTFQTFQNEITNSDFITIEILSLF